MVLLLRSSRHLRNRRTGRKASVVNENCIFLFIAVLSCSQLFSANIGTVSTSINTPSESEVALTMNLITMND